EKKAAAAQVAKTPLTPNFSHFSFPELVKAFYEGGSSRYASQPLIPLAYVSAINKTLNDQGMLFLIEDVKSYVRELDPSLSFEAIRKLQTTNAAVSQTTQAGMRMLGNVLRAIGNTRSNGGTVTEEVVAMNKALLGGGNANSGGASYVTVIEAKEKGTLDGRTLALMYDDNPEAFRQIYKGMIRYVRQEVR
ncbi:MAG: hypothetical protein V7727_04800, partial [Sneathiella sp.]